ncbi:MAG TPA: EamA family transporter [Gaiella sp.]|jgi:drug/metabolite transporter (DMT)-like permease
MADAPLPLPGAEQRDRRAALGYTMTLGAATLFAVNGSVSKLALEASDMGTMRWTELRSTGAFLGLLAGIALLSHGRLRVGRREAASLVVYGIVGFAFVQWLYFVAIFRLPIGIGLLLEFTAPVFVALWVRFVWRERVRDRVWFALALVLAGLALVAQAWEGLTLDRLGVTAGLIAAAALAVYYLAGERLVERRDPLSLVCIAIGAAAAFWAVVQPWWSFPFETLSQEAALPGFLDGVSVPVWALACWTIVLGTIAPFVLSIGALQHLPATTVTIVATFEPVAAAVVAWVWLDETLVAVQIVGGAIVLAGILLAETSR